MQILTPLQYKEMLRLVCLFDLRGAYFSATLHKKWEELSVGPSVS